MEVLIMDLSFLTEWVVPTTVGGCLIVGYILKNYVSMDNRNIPLIMALLGIAINVAIGGYVGVVETIFAGAMSGLASTGAHQVFVNLLDKYRGE